MRTIVVVASIVYMIAAAVEILGAVKDDDRKGFVFAAIFMALAIFLFFIAETVADRWSLR